MATAARAHHMAPIRSYQHPELTAEGRIQKLVLVGSLEWLNLGLILER